ncbi:MAG: hypothetical protein NTY33_00210 [Candidatus Moranbacteria bacterium]|nr:hypothetical protein [Candidatus Moranbacteria bacterium]
MKDFSKTVVEKIKKAHIIPESKLKLQWKSYLFWIIMLCFIIFGALSLSMVIFNIIDIDPRFLKYLGLQRLIIILFITAPYLWLLLSLSALIFGILAFRKTTKGYRRSTLFITSLVVLIISILGVFGHILKIDNRMGGLLSRSAPNFSDVTNPMGGRWQRPGDGLIAGEITNTEPDSFDLKSFDGQNWKIIYDPKTEIVSDTQIIIGEKVGIIGEKTGEFLMHAFSIKKFPADWNGEPSRGLMPPPGQNGQFPNGFPPPLPPPF